METAPIHKLLTYEELDKNQQTGIWPIVDSFLLSTNIKIDGK